MPDDDREQPEMDEAEKLARPELEKNWRNWSAQDVAEWWQRWHLRAGHKRLGRMLIDVAGRHHRRIRLEPPPE